MLIKISAFLSESKNCLSKGAKYYIKVKHTFHLFTVGKNYTFPSALNTFIKTAFCHKMPH